MVSEQASATSLSRFFSAWLRETGPDLADAPLKSRSSDAVEQETLPPTQALYAWGPGLQGQDGSA